MSIAIKQHVFTLSNFITILRLFCLYPVMLFYETNQQELSLLFIFFGMTTDVLDGYIARKTNTVSDLGKVLDPLVDKICLGILIIFFFFKGVVPLWLVSLLLVRDALIVIGGIYISRKKKVILMSLFLGKAAVTNVAIGFCFALFKDAPFPLLSDIFFYWSGVLLLLSFLQYAKRFFDVLKT